MPWSAQQLRQNMPSLSRQLSGRDVSWAKARRGELWANVCRGYLGQVEGVPSRSSESAPDCAEDTEQTLDDNPIGVLLRPLGEQ